MDFYIRGHGESCYSLCLYIAATLVWDHKRINIRIYSLLKLGSQQMVNKEFVVLGVEY